MARISPIEFDDTKRWSSSEVIHWPVAPRRRRGALGRLLTAIARQLSRQGAILQLRRLDPHLLRDIGIERQEIEAFVDIMLRQQESYAPVRLHRRDHRGYPLG
jgi:uncharacterized protein YjiS (DUF1127 family)